jgi:peptidoglycan/xylan/chitin deacetylase (PgdA/CDA1 family)
MMKTLIYRASKWAGAFRMARRATQRGVRILAYHGLALADEGRFRPQLFMEVGAFRQRMEYLVRSGYPVLSLGDAIEGLARDRVPAGATVITFDDGFYSSWKAAVPILEELKLPATIYATTYYCTKGTPVFRLAVQYLFWRTTRTALDLAGLGLAETGTIRFSDAASADELMWRIIRHAESQMEEHQRVQLSQELGRRLEVDYAEMVQKRILTLMTAEEIQEAARRGLDVELHTHRHCLPVEPALVCREIDQNRDVLRPLVGYTPRHLCYPSGVHLEEHRPVLEQLGVLSATTCDPGWNYADTPPLSLRRFLDGNHVPQIVFEAEMCGFSELLRRARSRVTRLVGRDNPDRLRARSTT